MDILLTSFDYIISTNLTALLQQEIRESVPSNTRILHLQPLLHLFNNFGTTPKPFPTYGIREDSKKMEI
jgi:hypothetical protein